MAQYQEISTAAPLTLVDGACSFRLRAEGGVLYYDQIITANGFGGDEGVDWNNIDSSGLPGVTRNVFRVGSRGGYYVTDQEMTTTGFDGAENTHWKNISEQSLTTPTSITLTTTKVGTFAMTLYGSALESVNVNWGDATNEDVTLSPTGVVASHAVTGANVIRIIGAENLTGIVSTSQSITVANIISALPLLETISLGGNLLTSFTGQVGWVALSSLDLNSNASLTSVTTCEEWVALTALSINSSPVTSLTTYASWTSLINLIVPNSPITSLETHAEWTGLLILRAENTSVANIIAHPEWTSITAFYSTSAAIISSTNINNILIALDASGMVGGEIRLHGGANAAPTGAGVTAKANLTGRGVTVQTN